MWLSPQIELIAEGDALQGRESGDLAICTRLINKYMYWLCLSLQYYIFTFLTILLLNLVVYTWFFLCALGVLYLLLKFIPLNNSPPFCSASDILWYTRLPLAVLPCRIPSPQIFSGLGFFPLVNFTSVEFLNDCYTSISWIAFLHPY